MMLQLACLIAFALLPIQSAQRATWREVEWSKHIASGARGADFVGVAEYRCPDGSRVDILSSDYAYEVEWSVKWKESIGQAVLYSILTDRKPGVILLAKSPDEEKDEYLRCVAVCRRLGIRLEWVDTRAPDPPGGVNREIR